MKVLVVIGTRPEAIKMAPLIRQLHSLKEAVRLTVCVTAQHREMLDQVLEVFSIEPDIDLDLMQESQNPSLVAARVLTALDSVLAEARPDWVLIQGDTTTTMAAALAAFHRGVRIGHIEAGLRTHDRRAPFPEEVNRIIAGQLADVHFAPTEGARRNLLQEGLAEESIYVTGNTVVDALHWALSCPLPRAVRARLESVDRMRKRPLAILATAHRRENHGRPLKRVCQALKEMARRHSDCDILLPVHPNPEVKRVVAEDLADKAGIVLLPPLDYLTLVHLMKDCALVLTDSGGIQEEASTMGVPILVLRERSDRPESVDSDRAVIVGTSPRRILSEARRILECRKAAPAAQPVDHPYGDGQAARRIVRVLMNLASDPEAH